MSALPPDQEAGSHGKEAPARPGQRLAGALVDGAALQVVALGLAAAGPGAAAALGTVVYLVYVVSLTAVRGQTLGKLALGTRVVDASTGSLPTLWQATTRAAVPLAGVIVDVAVGVAAVGAFWVITVYGWLLLDERHRGLHDRAAGTVVLDAGRTELHRRIGVAAVVAAVAVTAALVAAAVDDLDDEQPLTAPAAVAAASPG